MTSWDMYSNALLIVVEPAADFSGETAQHQYVMEQVAVEKKNPDASQERRQHPESHRHARLVQRPAQFQDYFMWFPPFDRLSFPYYKCTPLCLLVQSSTDPEPQIFALILYLFRALPNTFHSL